MRYTRSEIGGILSTRHGHSEDAAPSFDDGYVVPMMEIVA